jgi:SAM-dependent methyltransferase
MLRRYSNSHRSGFPKHRMTSHDSEDLSGTELPAEDQGVRRFDSADARTYWQVHSERRGSIDFDVDPEGLGNVCHPGAPLWLNRYYAKGQRRAFASLMARLESEHSGERALDVGCGTGRWSRLLLEEGYDVTGIDLQQELIARNTKLMPDARFVCSSIQDFADGDAKFDLAVSVTVIQHIPFDEQLPVIEQLVTFLRPGGHLLILENVHDQGPHVWSRSIDNWLAVFRSVGLVARSIQPYDYNFALRLVESTRRSFGGARSTESPSPITHLAPGSASRSRTMARVAVRLVQRVALIGDSLLEPLLLRRASKSSSVHCGFLLQKPEN